MVVVLAAGRWLLRPLFHVIAHSRLRELFTLAVLFVVLALGVGVAAAPACRWRSAGSSPA